jgi:hypothetical protein
VVEPTQSERFVRTDARAKKREKNRGVYWLMLLPVLGVLFPWIYNTDSPQFIGIPFFWWYQLAWVPGCAIVTFVVYRSTTKRGS